LKIENCFGVRRQSEAATALFWIVAKTLKTKSKAPSPLRSAGALQKQQMVK